ncbi:hypothetical protein [Oceanirhabdus sp. W0125-5]|uniref:hypothetical protein n=1 Tax=Oceanirhabdus sp. W0125-5 TaxID=2999116 RepID=UPI0022F2DAA1|nr:hypothetical protein [Oceanirhabdus sp. W0125-5]WBW96980.1 hypothetical protein OW730_25315 [Oceanirhabdus sp. W0125-5]
MDSRNNKLEEIKQFLELCSEEYIINFANKGLYKRANKEIDKGITMEYNIMDNYVHCKLSDGSECDIGDSYEDIKCSCPSKTTCKHMIIAIILLKKELLSEDGQGVGNEKIDESGQAGECTESCKDEQVSTSEEAWDSGQDIKSQEVRTSGQTNDSKSEQASSKEKFKWIEELDLLKLLNNIKVTEVEEILFRMNFGMKYGINKSSSIKVELYNGIEVILPGNGTMKNILCSCKDREICSHKVEAIIAYMLDNKHIELNEMKKSLCVYIGGNDQWNVSLEKLFTTKKLINKISKTGLSRMPVSILEDIELEAIYCGNAELPRLEKMLRGLKSMIEGYFKKHSSFSTKGYLKHLTRIFLIISSIEKSKDYNILSNTIGEKKTKYIPIGELQLNGIGAETWNSLSGYEGLTYYFYNEEKGKLFSFNDIMPTYYGNQKQRKLSSIYISQGKWNIQASMKDICRGELILENCKVNRNNRISSSKEINGEIIRKSPICTLDFKGILYKEWRKIREDKEKNFIFSIIDRDELDNILLIEPQEYGEAEFDQVNQRLTIEMYDKYGDIMSILVPFTKENEFLIRALERAVKKNKLGCRVLGRVYKLEGEYFIHPITFHYKNGELENIHID